jgi:hypothetical protein
VVCPGKAVGQAQTGGFKCSGGFFNQRNDGDVMNGFTLVLPRPAFKRL